MAAMELEMQAMAQDLEELQRELEEVRRANRSHADPVIHSSARELKLMEQVRFLCV